MQSAEYLPILALPYWDTIGGFVGEAVDDVAASTQRDPAGLYAAVTPYVLWCWQSRGLNLRRDRIFRRSLVDQFIHLATPRLSLASKATLRSGLWRAVDVLNPVDTSVSGVTLPRSAPTIPYSAFEIAELSSWAAAQQTARRREDASVLLSLGLGAGLATRELLEVTVADLTEHDGSVFVSVWASRPRVVPVIPSWQEALNARTRTGRREELAFRPGRQSAASNQVTDFLTRTRTRLDIRPARMRATWLSEHLAMGTSPLELLTISGLEHLAALQNSLNFAPRSGHKSKRSLLH